MTHPNIMFIMADQLAAPMLDIYDPNMPTKTPHLSKLASQAVVFDSAYCPSPLCAPSRYTLMASRLPHKMGAYDNAADFPSDIPTFAHYLRDAGYRTCLSGKMHFCGPDQLHGFEERLTTDIYPADYGWFPDWEDFETRPTWYHNMKSVTQAGTCLRSNQLNYDDEVSFQAERWLYQHASTQDSRPFCLTVSFTHPHDPYAALPEYWDRYEDVDIPMPKVAVPSAEQDPHSLRLRHVSDMDNYDLTEEQIRNARRAYMANTSYVDDQIGKLLSALDGIGARDNTIIVFSGDHGDMLGERGLWYKMHWYEWSARVPLLVSAPSRFEAKRVSANVSTLDLLPTFLNLAGGDQTISEIDGHSLMPHLLGEDGGHDEVIGEYLGEGAIAPQLMIRKGPLKYISCSVDPELLYDLSKDPDETQNLVDDPAYADALNAFRAQAASHWDSDTVKAQVIDSQKRRRMIARALFKGKMKTWDFQPHFDAAEQYMRNTIDLDDLEAGARYPRVED